MDAVQNTQDYQIAESSVEEFNNIMNFANGMTLKSSKEIDDAETKLSKFLTEILKRYFEVGLSEDEVLTLCLVADEFNKNIYKKFSKEMEDKHKLALFWV